MYSSAIVMLALSQAGALAAIVPLTAVAGPAAELYRPASSALLADLVTGIGFDITALATSAPALAATVVVWTLGEIVAAPVFSAYSPTSRRRTCAAATRAFGMSCSLALINRPGG